ncbi:MAG: T9SS C-terminal target domain-containing protein, partial [Bacteroidetes bacterium]
LYSSQWHLARIGLPKVWNQSIGGLTADGDTIVVAIMDSGFEIYHEDMVDNLWINHGEIAADSIDNDGNGYIDDLHGWDYFSDTPRIAPGLHGLGAAGIIGARGNNALGLSGVNWQVKLMYFSFRRIDHLIAAFEYVIDQRALYNESNGSRGSFVVAVNNSFGVENIFCDPPANAVYELWRDSYDAMGEVGILAAVSPANLSHNVDRFGDMPATCRSEYMIAACNTNEDDNLSGTASFGPESVDLAAPGDGSRSTAPNNSYGGYGQNSAAAPHVAGAIALLYSLPCAPLGYQARTAPSATALGIRNALLQGVEPLASLEGKTVTGGLLQVANSWEMMREIWCSNQPEELQIRKLYPNPTSGHPLRLEYLTPENGTFYLEFYNALGQLVRHTSIEIARSGPHLSSVPVDQLPSGVYILRFGQGDNWVIQRVVVAR